MAEQLPLALPVLTDLGEHAFLIADSNRQAVSWIDRWPDWPGRRLLLAGPAGGGKTHLARIWAVRAVAQAMPAAALTDAAPFGPAEGAAAWLVEDVQQLRSETGLLHLVNAVAEWGGHLLLTADRPVAELGLGLPDLRSRLATFPMAALAPPDEVLMDGVLRKLFADRQLQVPERIIDYLLPRMPRSLAAVNAVAAALDRTALARGRGVTLDMARQALALAENQMMEEEG
ncbi:hypothetical protein ACFOGJ_05335 [Marinibaculum pumilum]|uniref:Chromosomal replication initiator DnaA n=1 Tax=Marinibaculum pumilum TaxID=1766165 RepID=A0ABV7KWA4_9PROT